MFLGQRAGVRGYCLLSIALIGPTMAVAVGVGLGYERRALATWFGVSTVVVYGVYTLDAWLIVEYARDGVFCQT